MDSSAPREPARRLRTLHARGPANRLAVTSDLDPTEPVTEAEIQLVLAVLGDTIARILNPTSSECPKPPEPTSG
jgi:hypothetical protein